MTAEAYIRANYGPKYYNNTTNYNKVTQDNYAAIWEGDIDDQRVHIPFRLPEKASSTKNWKKQPKTLFTSQEGLREDEEYQCNENGILYYYNNHYYREYHTGAKQNYIIFYNEVIKEALKNLEIGDNIEVLKEDWKIMDISDYRKLGVLYTIKSMLIGNDVHNLDEDELVIFLNTGHVDITYNK